MALAEGRIQIAKTLRLDGAAGRAVLGVEIQHGPLPVGVIEAQRLTVAGGAFEWGKPCTDFGHGHSGKPMASVGIGRCRSAAHRHPVDATVANGVKRVTGGKASSEGACA
jgi:hypothetical protein